MVIEHLPKYAQALGAIPNTGKIKRPVIEKKQGKRPGDKAQG